METWHFLVVQGDTTMTEEKKTDWWKIILAAFAVIFGVGLLWACFDYTRLHMDMHDRVYQIVRLAVGMGAGFIAMGLAGPVKFEGTYTGVTIKAGGPTGIAIFFYLVDPIGV
jgi:hypothetical protein